ncbi:MAG: hypothetical protein JRJ20_14395 [Deltaproteobacteria bacterium]|nr:hypothetical protein [Deltaproteobacteria bacterium]
MALDSVLDIIDNGAWNGGTPIDNSMFENTGMFFKGNKPVNNKTIEERIGIRTRMSAAPGEKIGLISMQDLLDNSTIDSSRIRLIIGATNVGEDKYDPGPVVRHPYGLIKQNCRDTIAFDLYAGCPGFNVALELVFMLSLTGFLNPGDISVIVGAENIHRAKPFPPLDTSNIIFGDDSLATALETRASKKPIGSYSQSQKVMCRVSEDFITDIAKIVCELTGNKMAGGIILDNQIGKIQHRIPATAARVQHRLVELMFPQEASQNTFTHFKNAMAFYDRLGSSFAFDIMTLDRDKSIVEKVARAYIESGKYSNVVSVYLGNDLEVEVSLHTGEAFTFEQPAGGIIDTQTRTYGCFGDFIYAYSKNGKIFAGIDGKGVFLHATRSARDHLDKLLSRNNIDMYDLDLMVEHQANFAMIPLTMESVLRDKVPDLKQAVKEYVANRMVTNIHNRGNCSVVCMQRLPYDLERGVLEPDEVQGYPVNRNLEKLKHANLILYDSVGSGMTRSSFIRIKK